MRKVLFVAALSLMLSGIVTSCSGGGSSGPTVVSKWSGSFVGSTGSGVISDWTLMSDNTWTGTWVASASLSLAVSGTYTLSGTTATFTGSGNAVVASISTGFTLTGTGTLGSATGSGTFNCDFTASALPPSAKNNNGTWTVTKL